MKLTDFFFELPSERIARFPVDNRDESRLMTVERKTGIIRHYRFKDIEPLIREEDFLVVNNSRVIPAKLFGQIDGKRVDLLIVRILGEWEAEALTLPARRFRVGQRIVLSETVWAEVTGTGDRGKRILRFNHPIKEVLNSGFAPLPPYIKRKFDDAVKYRDMDLERYQTVYSRTPGSIAAPTAGLHFTPNIINGIKQKTQIVEITLDVGEATFQKIEAEDISLHKMGKETITITTQDRKKIQQLKQTKQLIAVGTTSVRSLETLALQLPQEETFVSELFISPGFEFKMVDKMITNFHLPESSLFILVSAFAGIELMQKAYRIAIEEGYRFFSYGDAMFIM